MARWRRPPAEPPAKLRCFDPGDWPDPSDWADDMELIVEVTRGWSAGADLVGWWASDGFAEFRARSRWDAARLDWADEHDVDRLELLFNDRLVPLPPGGWRG